MGKIEALRARTQFLRWLDTECLTWACLSEALSIWELQSELRKSSPLCKVLLATGPDFPVRKRTTLYYKLHYDINLKTVTLAILFF